MREDVMIYPDLVTLAACLEQEIVASELPMPCFVGVVEGDTAALDCGSCDDGCGTAWVRLDSAFPTTTFPEQDATNATCGTRLAFVVEVGMTRCFSPFGDEQGEMPGVAEHLGAARLQLADMAAMHRAIKCCFATLDTDYVLGQYIPVPFLGGCGGGVWTVTIAQPYRSAD